MKNKRLAVTLFSLMVLASRPAAGDELDAVDRFFGQCATTRHVRVHQERNPLDLHAVLYTSSNLMELEVLRLMDWMLDVPIPGARLRLIERSLNAMQAAYVRAARNRPMLQRVGELFDALQLRQLSLGDAAATYTGATGGVSLGSGTMVRIDKLINWTQSLVGDINELLGWPVTAFGAIGRRQGLIRWRGPGQVVDGAQKVVTLAFHGASVMVTRAVEYGVAGTERGVETVLNAGRPARHASTTVFVELPVEMARAHAGWILQRRRRIYLGTRQELQRLTHAELFHPRTLHPRPRGPRPAWWSLDRLPSVPARLVLVTDARTFASAPPAFRPYVVPAAWVLSDEPIDNLGSGP